MQFKRIKQIAKINCSNLHVLYTQLQRTVLEDITALYGNKPDSIQFVDYCAQLQPKLCIMSYASFEDLLNDHENKYYLEMYEECLHKNKHKQ